MKNTVSVACTLSTHTVEGLYSVCVCLSLSHTHSQAGEFSPCLCCQKGCLCVVSACSLAVYIHGESHLGGSQTVCLWPRLPLITHRVHRHCWQEGAALRGQEEEVRRLQTDTRGFSSFCFSFFFFFSLVLQQWKFVIYTQRICE